MPMQVESFSHELDSKLWSCSSFPALDSPRTLVLVFGAPEVLSDAEAIARLAKTYPRSVVVGCSSAGEIHGTSIRDKSLSVTVTKFDKTDLMLASMDVAGPGDSYATGQALAKKLSQKAGLRGVMILSEGLNVNGSELVRGINEVLDDSVVVTGGLSGDGSRFKQTWVSIGPKVKSNVVAAVGFYGDHIQIGHGSKGGWDKFGVERVVTKSEGNVLYELDGKPALLLYKEYLGDKAAELPASGLLFPLSLRASTKDDKFLVRTLLAVDHEKNSLTFAGDIPKGYLAQLMKADFERLIGGANLAAAMAKDNGTPLGRDSLVVAISCVGRRLVLGERTEEEVEAVLGALPKDKAQHAHITGFYSYGEISPYASGHCDLHNQTMTLTVFSESDTPLPKRAPTAKAASAVPSRAPQVAKAPPPPGATPSRPPIPPPSRAAMRPSTPRPIAPPQSPLDDSDLELLSANTDTRQLPSISDGGLEVVSLAYDLSTRRWSIGGSAQAGSVTFPKMDSPRTLVLAFGAPEVLGETESIAQLAKAYPSSVVVGCSSAGEIHGTSIRDKSLSVTVTKFDKTDLMLASMDVAGPGDSYATGQALAKKLSQKAGLRGVMILSEGLNVNGSELVRGINEVLDDSVVVTGGLSGDGSRFKQTWVSIGPKVKSNVVAAVGFYGDHIQIGHGSKGGWDKFGVERVVTKSEGNVLYELDGKPALLLYKEYLGDKAAELPASGLLFPLSLRASTKDDKFLVRTLLAVDHEKNSLTFAGDIPKGYLAQLMKADFERLIGGANLAAAMAKDNGTPLGRDSLVVAISCVGRRLVLGERTEEEVEAVLGALPKDKAQHAHITGFYSYGEISPYASGHCDLHNQTMTLTVFSESDTPLPKRAPTVKAPPVPARARGLEVLSLSYDMASRSWTSPDQKGSASFPKMDSPRTLVLAFGAPEVLGETESIAQLAKAYPSSVVVGCSSAGEIHGTSIRDKSLSVTVTKFDKTDLMLASMDVAGPGDSYATGQALAKKLSQKAGLRGVMILSEGLNVNGSELVRGINEVLDDSVVVTGGLSGDGSRFKQTWVSIGPKVKSNVVAAVGFYGDHIQIGHGSKGGWDKFGVERVVTKSEGNVLYELDGKPALLLYKEYLGDKAAELPASGLLFPLSLRASTKDDKFLVRTLLAVDHEKNSLTFAGDIPKGYLAQLMKADFERLIGGANLAAAMAKDNGTPLGRDSLVVAISCVGRRLVLGERTEEEVEAVLGALPKDKAQHAHITGFYSYGEISPYASGHCDLHNQTMTLTVFSESDTPLPKRAAAARPVASQTARLPEVTAAMPERPVPAPITTQSPSSGHDQTLKTANPLHVPPPAPSSPSDGAVFVRLPLQGTGAGATVQRHKRDGDVTLLTINGRLTETFKGDALGRELHGTIAIDLANVDRVTSFGVREWLSMLAAMQDVRRLFLLRCSESIVNQLGMIRKFSGNGQVTSFFAPYLCGSCGEQFERGFDCERDAEMIRAGRPASCACPQCGGDGTFDDDPRSYFAFAAPHLNSPIPSEIRAIMNELEAAAASAPREAVDKIVEGNVTRVRLHGNLGTNVRWKRVLDGIEGALVMDLGGVTNVEAQGISSLEQSLRGIGVDVTSILLERCPSMLIDRFIQGGVPRRVQIASAALDAYCPSCAVHRPAVVSLEEHGEALDAGQVPHVDCKRCNGELELRSAGPQLQFLRAQRHPVPTLAPNAGPPSEPVAPSLSGMSLGGPASGSVAIRPTDDVVGPATAVKTDKRPPFTAIAIGALTLAVLGLFGMQLARSGGDKSPTTASSAAQVEPSTPPSASAAPASTSSTPTWTENVELPPAWVERPIVFEGNEVFVVGKGEPAATAEMAIANARTDAVVRLVRQIHQDLAGTAMHEFLQPRVKDSDKGSEAAIAARFTKQFGTTAAPERVDSAIRKRDSGFDGYARYKLSKGKYQDVLNAYKDTTNTQGMTIGRFFPLLETTMHSDGDLVVLATQRGRPASEQGVRPGDVVLSISSRAVSTTEGLSRLATEEWTNTPARQSMSMEIESAGAKRTIRFYKPAP